MDISEVAKSTATLGLLELGTRAFDHGERKQHAAFVEITNVRIVPYYGMKMVFVQAQSRTGQVAGVQVYGVEFSWDQDNEFKVKIPTDKSGKYLFMTPINYQQQKVSVRCTCPDFRFTFAFYVLKKLGALIGGKLAPYHKKSNRPPRNPEGKPGMCKHLIATVDLMAKNQYFR